MCEDELFQSEVSSGRTISSQICPAQVCKANLWLHPQYGHGKLTVLQLLQCQREGDG